MGRITLFADIAGRVARDTNGNERVSVGAVGIETCKLDAALSLLPISIPKWRDATPETLAAVMEILEKHVDAIAVVDVDKHVPEWEKFHEDAARVNAWMSSHLRGPTGFTKAANVAKFWLFGYGVTIATATAIRLRRLTTLLDYRGREYVQQAVVCDGEIEGRDNVEAFHHLWKTRNRQQPLTQSLGIHIVTDSVTLASEQSSPLLNLPDYAAGLVHAALSPTNTMCASPISREQVALAFDRVRAIPCSVIEQIRFDVSFADVFPDIVLMASTRRP